MSLLSVHSNRKILAALLIFATLILSLPKPSYAAIDCASTIAGLLGGTLAGAGAVAEKTLAVPVIDSFNLVPNVNTSSQVTGLNKKSCLDVIYTAIAKTAVNLVRDMVLRWIITGRFEAPVFSVSFSIDAAKIAENASRIFLSQLTKINFCQTISPPSIRDFSFGFDYGLSCTLPGDIDLKYADNFYKKLYNPQQFAREQSLEDELKISNAENNPVYTLAQIVLLKDENIARALIAQNAEYLAGQGFLNLIDEKTGKTTTPGSVVARLVMKQVVDQPIDQGTVTHTVQEAVATIFDTAIRVLVEKGLTAATSR